MIHSPSPDAQRMRQYRQRRRMGMHTLRIALGRTQIDGLVRKGFLRPEDRDDRDSLEWAIDALIDTALDETT